MLIYIFIFGAILFFILKYYLALFFNLVSYPLSLILFFNFKSYKIAKFNLKKNYPNINGFKIFIITWNSYKNFVFNLFIIIIQNLFGDSFLYEYNNIKKYNIPKKCLIVLAHYGLFYDFFSAQKIFNKTIGIIYKSRDSRHANFKKIKTFKHNEINFNELRKNHIISTPIDHRSSDESKVLFLNEYVNFHSKLVDYSLKSNRDIYFYNVKIRWNSLELNIKKIKFENKSNINILQDIASLMSQTILNDPYQYLWNYDRFNIKHKI